MNDFAPYESKIVSRENIKKHVAKLKAEGKRIASLNGSFDLLHAGHLAIIFEAKAQADILVMALNSDLSIKQYKSPDRPIIPLLYRMQMVAALMAVDVVTSFDETTPHEILKCIHPDVHVNGDEYGENCIEAPLVRELGARLHIVKKKPGLSTTAIIQKIQTLCAI